MTATVSSHLVSPWNADGLTPLRKLLTVPYREGVAGGALPVVDSVITVSRPYPEPVLLLRLKRPLVDERVVVQATLVGGDAVAPVVFAPYSDAGSLLPVYAPPVTDGLAGDFALSLAVFYQQGDPAFADNYPSTGQIEPDDVADLLEGELVSGVFGKLLVLAGAEKQRVIAQAREIRSARHLQLARRSSLDARGVELGVPRINDNEEPDNAYRNRLAIYHQGRTSTPEGLLDALNGPGAGAEPNRGLPSLVGVKQRFTVVEEINPLSLALKLIAVGPSTDQLDRFHQRLRSDYLVDLKRPTSSGLADARRQRREEERKLLLEQLTLPDVGDRNRFLHPVTSSSLATAVRIARAAGHQAQIRLLGAHQPNGGSDFELGLTVELRRFSPAQLRTIASNLDRVTDPADAAIAAGMKPRSVDNDPLAQWFFGPCGFRTVVVGRSDTVLLSPFPMRGLRIEGPSLVARGQEATYRARQPVASTGGLHVLAAQGLDNLPDLIQRARLPRPADILSGPALRDTLESIGEQTEELPPAVEPMLGAGQVVLDGPAHAKSLLVTADLANAVAILINLDDLESAGDDDDRVAVVSGYGEAAFDAGFASYRGIWNTATKQLVFVVSISQLPGALSVPGQPPPAAYRWSRTELPAVSLKHRQPVELKQRAGGNCQINAVRPGVALVAVVGYARQGLADPYELRVELDDPDAVLDLDQYGYIMNLLDTLCPVGVEINTFDLRRRHVDGDGDGEPEWLTSRASRTFRQYRHPRWSRRSTGTSQSDTPSTTH